MSGGEWTDSEDKEEDDELIGHEMLLSNFSHLQWNAITYLKNAKEKKDATMLAMTSR